MSEARDRYYEFKIADEVWKNHRPPIIHYSAVDYITELEHEKAELLEKIKGLFSRSGYDKYDDGYDKAISDILDIFRKQEESDE